MISISKVKNLKKLKNYLSGYWNTLFLILFNTAAEQICGLFLPGIMSDIVDIGIKQKGFEDVSLIESSLSEAEIISHQTSYILGKGFLMMGITVLILALGLWTGYLSCKLSSDMSLRLRRDMFCKIINFSYRDFDKFSVSSLITRTTNDIESVKDLLLMSTRVVILPAVIVGGVIMAYKKCASMSGIIGWGSAGAVICVVIYFAIVTPRIKIRQSLLDKFNRIIKEQLSGTQLIRIFGKGEFEHDRFKNCNKELTSVSLFVNRVMVMLTPVLTAIVNTITVCIIWMGAEKISQSEMNVGDVMAFLQYGTMVITSFLIFSMIISSIPKAWVSVERVLEVLDTKDSTENSDNTIVENVESIEFKNVSFKYPGANEYVLKDINFSVDLSNHVGILGTTGSGKSTLIKLLTGLYKPSEGQILINGIDINLIDKKSIAKCFSYVPQNGILFSGSVSENMKIRNVDASDEKIIEALKISQIWDFVEEKGLDFKIVKNGSNVSGGQRQRLAIARALINDSSVYVFDDSFSRLDFRTDYAVRKALNEHLKKSIQFLVSQRIGTIKNSDKIIVLSEGKIVGMGTHEDLKRSCDIYSEMVQLQMGTEALA